MSTSPQAFSDSKSPRSTATSSTAERAYDHANNLVRAVDANGMVTQRSYDALGRMITSTSSRPVLDEPPDEGDGREGGGPPPPSQPPVRPETVTWSYDDPTPGKYAIGRLAAMTDPAGITTYVISVGRRGGRGHALGSVL